jgi:hypothetical protein
MKKFPREPMRPDKEPGAEVEIWQPRWNCFCCHDSGIVHHHLAALVSMVMTTTGINCHAVIIQAALLAVTLTGKFWLLVSIIG